MFCYNFYFLKFLTNISHKLLYQENFGGYRPWQIMRSLKTSPSASKLLCAVWHICRILLENKVFLLVLARRRVELGSCSSTVSFLRTGSVTLAAHNPHQTPVQYFRYEEEVCEVVLAFLFHSTGYFVNLKGKSRLTGRSIDCRLLLRYVQNEETNWKHLFSHLNYVPAKCK
jgi:hypothetical protein